MRMLHALSSCMCAVALVSLAGSAQNAKLQPNQAEKLPYGFSNIVWWSDDELRTLLKKRIPGLGDEIGRSSAVEGRVRDVLTALLKEKGIVAEVQSIEPSPTAMRLQEPQPPDFWQVQFPPPPKPRIEFSILTPSVVIGKIALMPQDEQAWQAFESEARENQGKPFGRFGVEFLRYRAQEVLRQRGISCCGG